MVLMVLEVILVVLGVVLVVLGVVLVVLGGSRLSFLMKVFLLKGPGGSKQGQIPMDRYGRTSPRSFLMSWIRF